MSEKKNNKKNKKMKKQKNEKTKNKKNCDLMWLTPPKSWATLLCNTAVFRYRNRLHIE